MHCGRTKKVITFERLNIFSKKAQFLNQLNESFQNLVPVFLNEHLRAILPICHDFSKINRTYLITNKYVLFILESISKLLC